MNTLRRKAVCVLLVAVFSICACATSAKRLSEDLQSEGLTICICDAEENATGPILAVTDAEATERVFEWFRHHPHASPDWEAKILQQAFAKDFGPFSQTIRIETARFRVNIPVLVGLVVLETRATPADEWNKASWIMREEDAELKQWALDEYKRLLMERGPMEYDVSEE